MALVDVDDLQLEADRRLALERAQQVQHRVAVFAAAHGDQDAIAVFDHREVGDGARHGAAELLLERSSVDAIVMALA